MMSISHYAIDTWFLLWIETKLIFYWQVFGHGQNLRWVLERWLLLRSPGNEGCSLLQTSPRLLPVTSKYKEKQSLCSQMCHTTSAPPPTLFQTGALGCTGFVVNLFPSHETLSTHTKRGCVGRQEDMCTLDLLIRTKSELPEDMLVSTLLIFLWYLWETAGILRGVLLFCWCNWYEDSLNEDFCQSVHYLWLTLDEGAEYCMLGFVFFPEPKCLLFILYLQYEKTFMSPYNYLWISECLSGS